MSLIQNTYGGIITKGLGMPAYCSLITMKFSVFSCSIDITPPIPPSGGGGGGGPYPKSMMRPAGRVTPNYHTPMNGQFPIVTQHVMVTISINGHQKISKHYSVSKWKGQYIVKVANLTSKVVTGINVVVENVHRLYRKVVVRIRNK